MMINTIKTFRTMSRPPYCRVKVAALFCLILLSSIALSVVNAATYYVDDVNGVDSAAGSSAAPWKTLAKAQTVVVSGDTVYVRNGSYGIYTESELTSRTNWINYKAVVGHHPELTSITAGKIWSNYNAYLVFDGFAIRPPAGYSTAIHLRNTKFVKLLNLDIAGHGANYVENISGTKEGILVWGSYSPSDITIDHCKLHGINTGPLDGFVSAIVADDANNLIVTNNDISQFHAFGVGVKAVNVTIKGNDIHNFSADAGIGIGGPGNGPVLVENNKVHDCRLYQPILSEIPTATTWSADGKTMSNPNATWGINKPIAWANAVEIVIISGNHVITGDRDNTVATVVSPTQIVLNNSIGNGSGTPSNVNYILRDSTHTDLIQVYAYSDISNLTIINNQFYDTNEAFGNISPYPHHGSNFLIENNLFWNNYSQAEGTNLWIDDIDGLNLRDNTVIGGLLLIGCANIRMSGNIVSYMTAAPAAGLIEEDYNIFNRGSIGQTKGAHTTFFWPEQMAAAHWNDPAFTGIFTDYTRGDFRLASVSSLGVGHGDPANSPLSDILGNSRDSSPDAGCYEYVTSDSGNHAPILVDIGSKSVNENSALNFSVSATDTDGDAITYSAQNLPGGATFVNQEFNWTPAGGQAGIYLVAFIADDGHAQDSETVTITVNSANTPAFDPIDDKSVRVNSTLTFPVNATSDNGDTIIYSAQNLPSGAEFANQTFVYTPTETGIYHVTFVAANSAGDTFQTIVITVKNSNTNYTSKRWRLLQTLRDH